MSIVRRRGNSLLRISATWLLFYALTSLTVFPQQMQTHDRKRGPGVIEIGPARVEIHDVEVLDQDGRKVRFYSDLIKDKVVVLNFFFTSCTFVCLPQGRSLAKLKAGLAERFGREVFFVSVTRDPETDTPRQLKRWGAGVGAANGWTLVTGQKGVMTKLIADFTGDSLGTHMHSSVLFIGNDRTGVWMEAEGLAPADEILSVINRVAGSVDVIQR